MQDVDLVFATVGGKVIPRSFGVMKPTGRLVTSGQMEGEEEAQCGLEAHQQREAGRRKVVLTI